MLATKAAMQANGISGTLKFFGEPAEKVCGSKPVHAAKGYFDGCDAFIACHPHTTNSVCGETQCGAYWSAVITFETLAPETWIDKSLLPIRTSSHATARCPGAIDALCLMYTTTKYTKEAMYPHSGAWTLNEFILVGGDATSDNLPPRFSQIQYSWRSPSLAVQQQIEQVLRNNARHAAALCGCQASLRWVTKTRVGLPNRKLTEITWRNMQRVGAPAFGDEARDFARAIQRNLGIAPMGNPFIDDNEQLLSPEALEARQRTSLPPGQLHIGADDYVEYTWHAPTVGCSICGQLCAPPTTAMNIPPGRAMRWVDCQPRSIQACSWAPRRLPARFSICSPIRPSWQRPGPSSKVAPAVACGERNGWHHSAARVRPASGPALARICDHGAGNGMVRVQLRTPVPVAARRFEAGKAAGEFRQPFRSGTERRAISCTSLRVTASAKLL